MAVRQVSDIIADTVAGFRKIVENGGPKSGSKVGPKSSLDGVVGTSSYTRAGTGRNATPRGRVGNTLWTAPSAKATVAAVSNPYGALVDRFLQLSREVAAKSLRAIVCEAFDGVAMNPQGQFVDVKGGRNA